MDAFRSRLRSGERLYGTMLTLPNPAVAEVLASSGFDWLFIDGEHGPFTLPSIQAILQAVGDRVACVVRIPELTEGIIKQTLDLGTHGIIVPQCNSVEQAENAVRWSKYPPVGSRGVGLGRAHNYGLAFAEYVERANEAVSVIVQMEHIDAVNQIDAISSVEGVDAILLGPYDLSASMGKMGQVKDEEVVAAIERVTSVCQAKKMALGYFGVRADDIIPYVQQGYNLIVGGVDTLLLASSAGRMLKQLRES